MPEEKIFDVRKVKLDKKPLEPVEEEVATSVVKLHVRYFDWHTLSYVLYGLAVLLAFVAAVFATRFFVIRDKANQNTKLEQTTQPTTPEQAVETKPEGANPFAPPETPATNETTSTEIDKKSIRMRVLNGNGITGDAAKIQKQLETAGFTVQAVGNAKRQDYPTTQVYYLAGQKSQAELVNETLKTAGRSTTLEEASADLVGVDTDVLIVTGKT